ncbi:MAG: hypothetical protein COU31_04355 [Candidatus Magasanikbacteria bacterium CG10_big_fil_rev_8_21_14_0_10_40_10]|uniref:Uncharacterized protein n=1 Tax=Candidatus Magasanikbacteria bacterium CG10_big_fil_rev_8_21_14_0_10_40_10 TaxID=1974648 RepID=A0A2M6W2X9_9BACT|nr:MAG: hypothetical protein COU31_04355 [Candidatus Magasanikbacteria bacterium CG10_big_fil_rev_8_21_14_0_10_40_10]
MAKKIYKKGWRRALHVISIISLLIGSLGVNLSMTSVAKATAIINYTEFLSIYGNNVVAIGEDQANEMSYVVLYDISNNTTNFIDGVSTVVNRFIFIDVSDDYVAYGDYLGNLHIYNIASQSESIVATDVKFLSQIKIADNKVIYVNIYDELVNYDIYSSSSSIIANYAITETNSFDSYLGGTVAMEDFKTPFVMDRSLKVAVDVNAGSPTWYTIPVNPAPISFWSIEIDKNHTAWLEDHFGGVRKIGVMNNKTITSGSPNFIYPTLPVNELIESADIFTYDDSESVDVNLDKLIFCFKSFSPVTLKQSIWLSQNGYNYGIHETSHSVIYPKIYGDYVVWSETVGDGWPTSINPAEVHLYNIGTGQETVILPSNY